MFDLVLMDAAGAGVPVPLPGRGLVYLGGDIVMRVKLHDGSVLPVAGGGAPGGSGAAALVGGVDVGSVLGIQQVDAAMSVTTGGQIYSTGGNMKYIVSRSSAYATAVAIPAGQIWAVLAVFAYPYFLGVRVS